MGEARWARAAAVAGVVMLALWIIAVVLAGLDHQLTAGNVTTSAGFAVFAGVGVVVALHQPRNPVGWLLISFTFFFMLGIDAQEYAVYCYLLGHRLPFASAAVVLKQSANFAFFLLPLAVFLFPDEQADLAALVVGAVGVRGGLRLLHGQRLRSGDRGGSRP